MMESDYGKVHLLVEHGADVNVRSGLGNTALILAARATNSHRTVDFLLSRGADARATNNSGATALMAAAAGGDVQSARLLIMAAKGDHALSASMIVPLRFQKIGAANQGSRSGGATLALKSRT
jgi:ankyrin repeat protein